MWAACCGAGGVPGEVLLDKDGKAISDEEEQAPKVSVYQWALVVSMIFYQFLDGLQMTQPISYLPDYFEDNGLSQTYVGLCTFALYFGMLCGNLTSPPISDYFGNLAVMKVGLVIIGVGHLMVALICPHLTLWSLFGVYFTLRLILGYFEGLLSITAAGIIIRCLPESVSPMAIGAMEASRTLAFLIAPIFGSALFLAGGSSFRLPYLILGIILLAFLVALQFLLSISKGDLLNRGVQVEKPNTWALVKKPPVIALLIAVLVNFIPVSAIEPALEPYLTGAPFNISVSQVGLTLVIISVADVTGAMIAAPLSAAFGHVPMLYITVGFMLTSTFLLAEGPQTWLAVILSFIPASFGTIPSIVIAPAVMMRICRSFDMDPKVYSEVVMAIITGACTAMMAVFSLVGGVAVDALGFRTWFLILACIICVSPFVIFWGFHPSVMGRPLAPMADEETDAAEDAKRIEKMESSKKN